MAIWYQNVNASGSIDCSKGIQGMFVNEDPPHLGSNRHIMNRGLAKAFLTTFG